MGKEIWWVDEWENSFIHYWLRLLFFDLRRVLRFIISGEFLLDSMYSNVLKYRNIAKIAHFKSKYLENSHEYKNCQLGKLRRILFSLQKCLLFEFFATKFTKVRNCKIFLKTFQPMICPHK